MVEPPKITDRPAPDGSDIRKMTPADIPAIAHALALALYEDPHMSRGLAGGRRVRRRPLLTPSSLRPPPDWGDRRGSSDHIAHGRPQPAVTMRRVVVLATALLIDLSVRAR